MLIVDMALYTNGWLCFVYLVSCLICMHVLVLLFTQNARAVLTRYIFYLDRYLNHLRSHRLEIKVPLLPCLV